MKHLKPRDILEILLFLICFITIFALAGYLETAPISSALWLGGGFAIVMWAAYIITVSAQRKREAARMRLKIMSDGVWVDVDTPEGVLALSRAYKKPNVQLFDQDDYIIEKEQA